MTNYYCLWTLRRGEFAILLAAWIDEGAARSAGENDAIDELISEMGGNVIQGDRSIYEYTESHQNSTVDGIHFNATTASFLGEKWAMKLLGW